MYMTLHPIPLNFLIHEENFLLFLSVTLAAARSPHHVWLTDAGLRPPKSARVGCALDSFVAL